jgi:hypothetical protein
VTWKVAKAFSEVAKAFLGLKIGYRDRDPLDGKPPRSLEYLAKQAADQGAGTAVRGPALE